jgi:hypothetical protein
LNTATVRRGSATGSNVSLLIDGITSPVTNTGEFGHLRRTRGQPIIEYRVCDSDGCSDVVRRSWSLAQHARHV